MSESVCDKACEILQKTNDGNDLDPLDLWLLQEAVNGHLTEEGMAVFEKLHQKVLKGYQKPWFHGIEHLTLRNSGYVLWKGQTVEHYTVSWAYSDNAKAQAAEIAARCRHLETIGVEVSMTNTVWCWEKYQPAGWPVTK